MSAYVRAICHLQARLLPINQTVTIQTADTTGGPVGEDQVIPASSPYGNSY